MTVTEYKQCVEVGKCKKPNTGTYCNWGKTGRNDHPINCVNWYDANSYCKWINGNLPTEAQWEYAARGKNSRKYPWGNNLDEHYANYGGISYIFGSGLAPVGFFDGTDWGEFITRNNTSPFNVYDMAGNVWEWCLDFYSETCYANSVMENPKGPFFGGYRVVRGGSWNSDPKSLRCAERHFYFPHFRHFNSGFRCVREK